MDFKILHDSLKSDYFAWQAFLDSWLGRNYIREITVGYAECEAEVGTFRKMTTDTNQLLRQLLFYCDPMQNVSRGRKDPNIWASVYRYEQETPFEEFKRPRPEYSSAVIDRLLFDFDVPLEGKEPELDDLNACWEEVKVLADDYKGRIIFSGRKGFQVHIKLDAPLADRAALRAAQERIHAVYDLQFSDVQIYGDLARVCRLPYTLHGTSGRQAIPVTALEEVEKYRETFIKPKSIGG